MTQPMAPVLPNVSFCVFLCDCPHWTEPLVAPGAFFSASVPAMLAEEKTKKSSVTGLQTAAIYDEKQWISSHLSFPVAAVGKWDIGILGYRKPFQKSTTNPLLKHLLLKTANN